MVLGSAGKIEEGFVRVEGKVRVVSALHMLAWNELWICLNLNSTSFFIILFSLYCLCVWVTRATLCTRVSRGWNETPRSHPLSPTHQNSFTFSAFSTLFHLFLPVKKTYKICGLCEILRLRLEKERKEEKEKIVGGGERVIWASSFENIGMLFSYMITT